MATTLETPFRLQYRREYVSHVLLDPKLQAIELPSRYVSRNLGRVDYFAVGLVLHPQETIPNPSKDAWQAFVPMPSSRPDVCIYSYHLNNDGVDYEHYGLRFDEAASDMRVISEGIGAMSEGDVIDRRVAGRIFESVVGQNRVITGA